MSYWDNIKKDFQRTLKESVHLLKEKAEIMKLKAEELAEEGKKKYKIFDIQMRIQEEIAELGGRIYDLSSKSGNPLNDKKVLTLISRIKKLETKVTRLEEGNRKKSARAKTRQNRGMKRK